MAKILKEGCAHTAWVWEDTCNVCQSRLRMFSEPERHDPAVMQARNCGAYFKGLKYTCPVCGYVNETFAANNGDTGCINNDECKRRAELGHTTRKLITLTLEDLEELEGYKKA